MLYTETYEEYQATSPPPRTYLILSLLIPLALLAASCSNNSDSTTSDRPQNPSETTSDFQNSNEPSPPDRSPDLSRDNTISANPQNPTNKAIAITTNGERSCALHQDGTISCWGNNEYGQLGNGTTNDSLVPVQVQGISDATTITTTITGSCALHEDGTISCWGSGPLGNGTTEGSLVPVQVRGITDATAITTSGGHSCALHEGGTISCWGNNDYGQLGNGTGGGGWATVPDGGDAVPDYGEPVDSGDHSSVPVKVQG